MVEVRFSSRGGVRCAWQNCRQSIEKVTSVPNSLIERIASGEPLRLPPGWRMLIISSGSTVSDSEDLMTSAVNAALCPDHVKELYKLLNSETFALTIHEAPKPPKK
jgi:hypothetical protein